MDKILKLIKFEEQRQRDKLVLIASENYTSKNVRSVLGSALTHKYSEGEPDRRYYQGNEYIDQIEKEVNARALKVFGLNEKKWHVNVKANSASIANLTVITALLEPGQKILAMNLTHGGHLSHGWKLASGKPISFIAKIFKVAFYEVEKNTQVFDYDKILKIAKKEKPQLIISGGTAYARDINYKKMSEIAKKVGAYYLADIAHEAGLVAGKILKSPFPHADVVTMSTQKTLRGPRGAIIICKAELKDKIDRALFPGLMGGPSDNVIASIGICLQEAQTNQFKKYAQQTIKNAKILSAELKKYGFNIVSGGTDKHLLLIDLRNLHGRDEALPRLTGTLAAQLLDKAGIVCNKNTVPFETGTPNNPSGIRLGTPALTTRGMKEPEMKIIARWIKEVLIDNENPKDILKQVKKLTKKFPI
jgi:glycine hydroxymethyltransferase